MMGVPGTARSVVVVAAVLLLLGSLGLSRVTGQHAGGSGGPIQPASLGGKLLSTVVAAPSRSGMEPVRVLSLPGPSGLSSSASSHWWVGEESTISSLSPTSANSVQVTIQVPDDSPNPTEFYYVLLSTWDSAGSYDQVGFASDYGVWGLVWSYTTGGCGSPAYVYSTDAYELSEGTSYTFAMSIASGLLTYRAFGPEGALLFSTTANTGGSNFWLASDYWCGASSYLDYTNYEEHYTTVQSVPSYSFFFTNSLEDGNAETNWQGFGSGSPSGINTEISGANAIIENEAFYLSLPGGSAPVAAEAGGNLTTGLSINPFYSNGGVTLSSDTVLPGLGITLSPYSGTPEFTSLVTISIPASEAGERIPVEIQGLESSGLFTEVQLNVEVLPHVSVSTPTASPASLDSGQSSTLSVEVSGGEGPFTLTWHGTPPGCPGENTTQLLCQPSGVGTSSVTVSVVDALGYSYSGQALSFTVYEDPTVTLSASPSTVDGGQIVSLDAVAAGGSGGFRYVWNQLPGCPSGDRASLLCDPSVVGRFAVNVSLSDSNGFDVDSNSVTVTVYSDPTVSPSTQSRSIVEGRGLSLHFAAAGGIGPYTYSWTGLPAGCQASDSNNLSCVPSRAGSYTVVVEATDTLGYVARGTVLLTVQPAFFGTSLSETSGLEFVVAPVLAAAGVAAGAALALRRRRERGPV
jgi:hypothetical protein